MLPWKEEQSKGSEWKEPELPEVSNNLEGGGGVFGVYWYKKWIRNYVKVVSNVSDLFM